LPTLFVIILAAVALTEAGAPPSSSAGRRIWLGSIMFFGALALASSVWQGKQEANVTGAVASAESDSTAKATRAQLAERVEKLEKRIKELEEGGHGRSINADTAAKFAEYLRQFGSHRVVVSCAADDLEAYNYANQLVNILKAASWDAEGPEVTEAFGDLRAIGVNLYVNGDSAADTAHILLDGFEKFNIPHRSRVMPTQAIPDAETVELYVGSMPSQSATMGSD
jgi:cell division protein FtsB